MNSQFPLVYLESSFLSAAPEPTPDDRRKLYVSQTLFRGMRVKKCGCRVGISNVTV